MAWRCRYWILIQDKKSGSKPFIHTLAYQIKWSSGWSSYEAQYQNDWLVNTVGPFNTRNEMLSFYYANRDNFLGGINARLIDMADRSSVGDCQDQA